METFGTLNEHMMIQLKKIYFSILIVTDQRNIDIDSEMCDSLDDEVKKSYFLLL